MQSTRKARGRWPSARPLRQVHTRNVVGIAASIVIALGGCPVGAEEYEAPPFESLATAHLCGLDRIGFKLYLSDRWGHERVKAADLQLLEEMIAGGIPIIHGDPHAETPQFYVAARIFAARRSMHL